MKKLWMTKVGLAALLLAGVVDAGADDLVARIGFIGSISKKHFVFFYRLYLCHFSLTHLVSV